MNKSSANLNTECFKEETFEAANPIFNGSPFVIPTISDILVMYSTVEGHVAFRNRNNGSFFIQALCKELEENHKEHLLNILTFVINDVTKYESEQRHLKKDNLYFKYKQLPSIQSSLTKNFYFPKK